jgi:hypothetical protein
MVVMCIPTYKRERWITDEYLANIHEYLIKPLKGQIRLFLYVQDPNPHFIPFLNAMALKFDFDIMYVDAHTMSIAEVRYNAIKECFNRYAFIDHVLTADDDMYITSPRVEYDYRTLIGILEPDTTYVLYPGTEFSIEDYVHPQKLNSYKPGMLRGQIYPRTGFMSLDASKLNEITCGEDYVIPRLVDAPIKWVTGFNENIHLCSRTIEHTGVLRKWYNWNGKETARYYWEKLKTKYQFDKNGYDPERADIGYTDFHRIYPEYFSTQGFYKY